MRDGKISCLSTDFLDCKTRWKTPPSLIVSQIADKVRENKLKNKHSLHPCYGLLDEQDLAAMNLKGAIFLTPQLLSANLLSTVDYSLIPAVTTDVFPIKNSLIYQGLSLEDNRQKFIF
ncbi:MAG: hypothetical protein HC908_11130 [Calothrix sp. SM1_7_51]|nr:hypothetical protein [Calothrix sp. SM1_7_51]